MDLTRNPEYVKRFKLVAETAKWAVTMTKVRIRQATADKPWPHWHLLSFTGPDGRESRGVVDLIAVRKDHGEPLTGSKRGDALEIILIQVKGGGAAKPTADDATRLRIIARFARATSARSHLGSRKWSSNAGMTQAAAEPVRTISKSQTRGTPCSPASAIISRPGWSSIR